MTLGKSCEHVNKSAARFRTDDSYQTSYDLSLVYYMPRADVLFTLTRNIRNQFCTPNSLPFSSTVINSYYMSLTKIICH